MSKKIKIPKYVKETVKKALEERKKLPVSERYGLTKKQAEKKGIQSGVERANQLKNNSYITEFDARRIIAFYERFKGCKTKKCEGAINLWGGRKFAQFLRKIYK